jgi:hypothetical protein
MGGLLIENIILRSETGYDWKLRAFIYQRCLKKPILRSETGSAATKPKLVLVLVWSKNFILVLVLAKKTKTLIQNP